MSGIIHEVFQGGGDGAQAKFSAPVVSTTFFKSKEQKDKTNRRKAAIECVTGSLHLNDKSSLLCSFCYWRLIARIANGVVRECER